MLEPHAQGLSIHQENDSSALTRGRNLPCQIEALGAGIFESRADQNHMGSLLGYGRQYRWQFRLDSDDFQLAVLRQAAASNRPFILVLSAASTLILSNLPGNGTAG
jgi:hypothetical protein